jgi:hypothetical protein
MLLVFPSGNPLPRVWILAVMGLRRDVPELGTPTLRVSPPATRTTSMGPRSRPAGAPFKGPLQPIPLPAGLYHEYASPGSFTGQSCLKCGWFPIRFYPFSHKLCASPCQCRRHQWGSDLCCPSSSAGLHQASSKQAPRHSDHTPNTPVSVCPVSQSPR